jgi:hypothetical protein
MARPGGAARAGIQGPARGGGRGGARGGRGGPRGVNPQRADFVAHALEAQRVRQQEGTNLKWSTVSTYVTHLVDYEKYLLGREGGGHMLLSPRVLPLDASTWPSVAERKNDPMLHFKRHPLNIDLRIEAFDMITFQAWLTRKCKTPKENGHFPSWKRNSKATCAIVWAFRNASYITRGRIANQRVPESFNDDMKSLKGSLGKFFDEMRQAGTLAVIRVI